MKITFVDDEDNVIGAGTKQEAWDNGIRHRIVRIYLFNSRGEILLARRGLQLESLPGRWNESAAGHVDEGEEYDVAAQRELQEELGVAVPIKKASHFKSEETDEPDKQKKRFTAVYVGQHDGDVSPSEREVAEVKWLSPKEIGVLITENPDDFTEGFIRGFNELVNKGVISV